MSSEEIEELPQEPPQDPPPPTTEVDDGEGDVLEEVPQPAKNRSWAKLFQYAHPAWQIVVSIGLLAGLHGADRLLQRRIAMEQAKVESLDKTADQLAQVWEHYSTLKELKSVDIAQFKA